VASFEMDKCLGENLNAKTILGGWRRGLNRKQEVTMEILALHNRNNQI
jgi:hypothetical protein